VEIALAMYRSDRCGAPVRLPLTDEERVWE
jgi:hypothetical protein